MNTALSSKSPKIKPHTLRKSKTSNLSLSATSKPKKTIKKMLPSAKAKSIISFLHPKWMKMESKFR
jgi:hypothetical protein